MELIPFKKVTNVPNGLQSTSDILSTFEFIDIADEFNLVSLRGTRESYYQGLVAYMFEAQLKFEFHNNYTIESVEFRRPYNLSRQEALFYQGINLFMPTLLDVQEGLKSNNIATRLDDVGIEAPDIGISFFSSDYEEDLNVSLDAVTVHFDKSIFSV